MKSLSGTQETNVIKLVHHWQNDGHQKFLHSEGEEIPTCPACGDYENHYHFFCCKDPRMKQYHQEQQDSFKKTHGKLHTALPIYNSFKSIISLIKLGTEPIQPLFETDSLGIMTKKAWQEQRKIGWSNLIKGRMSKQWGKAQQIYYSQHPTLSQKKLYNKNYWTSKTIQSFINFSLQLWNSRCDILHGEELKDKKNKNKRQPKKTNN